MWFTAELAWDDAEVWSWLPEVRSNKAFEVAKLAQRPAGRTVVVDRLAVWQGRRVAPVDLSVAEAWIEEACKTYRAPLVYDPFQAAHLTQRLERRGVRVEAFTFSSASVGKLATTLFALLRDHCLDLPSDDRLVDELCSVKLRETTPGVVRLDHLSSGHDDQAVTVAMCAAYLIDNPADASAGSVLSQMRPIPRRGSDGIVNVEPPWVRSTRFPVRRR